MVFTTPVACIPINKEDSVVFRGSRDALKGAHPIRGEVVVTVVLYSTPSGRSQSIESRASNSKKVFGAFAFFMMVSPLSDLNRRLTPYHGDTLPLS